VSENETKESYEMDLCGSSYGHVVGSDENGNGPLVLKNCLEFLEYMSNY
jgi:hypothetical protein